MITSTKFNEMLRNGEVKLPAEFKAKWLEALRGGDFQQGGMLYEKLDGQDTYCCLGVAGKLAGISNEELVSKGVYSTDCFKGQDLKKYSDMLPKILVSHRDLDLAHHLQLRIAKMNDGTTNSNPDIKDIPPKSFAEIADWIEETL